MPELTEIRSQVQALPAADRKALTLETAGGLSDADRKEVARFVGEPSQSVTNSIWLRVVTAFFIVLVVAFVALAASVYFGKEQPLLPTAFTTVAAFLCGLLPPILVSPK